MNCPIWRTALGMILFGTGLVGQETTPASGNSASKEAQPFHVQFVSVSDDVKLEVIDWGGTGRPLVLLAGMSRTAHTFHKFAPELTSSYHVYGITRRGFGASTIASSGYSTDELGDDVVEVIDYLGLKKPVLAGHSFAGAELSSIATRYPGKAAGVIYLDAGNSYAFYDEDRGDLDMDTIELKKKLEEVLFSAPPDGVRLIDEVLRDLPRLEKNLRQKQKQLAAVPMPAGGSQQPLARTVPAPIRAMILGQKKFTAIPGPVLAIYAFPETESEAAVEKEAQVKAFETGVPSARVVRIANARHAVFSSNPDEVLREMRAFIDALP